VRALLFAQGTVYGVVHSRQQAFFSDHPCPITAKMGSNSSASHGSLRYPRHSDPSDRLLTPPRHLPGGQIGPVVRFHAR
jgi:hypothetical protein